MSLDVYLKTETLTEQKFTSGIFIREEGQVKEIRRDEWDARFPGCEPIVAKVQNDGYVYGANITHNLNRMATEAGIYLPIWRPEEIGITKAYELVAPLTTGLALLKNKPKHFKQFNPPNGWGSYDGLVAWVEDYLEACKEYPQATVKVSR